MLEQEFWHLVLLAPDTLRILESWLVSEQLQFLKKEISYKQRYNYNKFTVGKNKLI